MRDIPLLLAWHRSGGPVTMFYVEVVKPLGRIVMRSQLLDRDIAFQLYAHICMSNWNKRFAIHLSKENGTRVLTRWTKE